ncbi:hypothetical protein PJP10_32400, partial [Mycobacterium kansasii]
MAIQDRIAALKEEISQLEKKSHEQESALQYFEERMRVTAQFIDTEKSALLQNRDMITSLEDKLAGVPDQEKL